MRKLFTFILIFTLLLPVISRSETDVTSMSDQELKDMITSCSDELRNRAKIPEQWILIFEYESIKIYQIDDATISSNKIISVPVAIINDMDFDIYVTTVDEQINGWEVSGWGYSVSHNAKKKTELRFFADDAFVNSLDDVVSLKFSWWVQNDTESKYIYKQEEAEEHRFW